VRVYYRAIHGCREGGWVGIDIFEGGLEGWIPSFAGMTEILGDNLTGQAADDKRC